MTLFFLRHLSQKNYRNALNAIELSAPTTFSDVISFAAAEAAEYSFDGAKQKYFVLLLLTDGVITRILSHNNFSQNFFILALTSSTRGWNNKILGRHNPRNYQCFIPPSFNCHCGSWKWRLYPNEPLGRQGDSSVLHGKDRRKRYCKICTI